MSCRPFTPETLAERWGCSSQKIRQMSQNGDLACFRLGRLIRIPAIEVERIECQLNQSQNPMKSSNIEESSPSQLVGGHHAAAFRLARMTPA